MNHLLKTKLRVLKQNYNILNLLSRKFVIFFLQRVSLRPRFSTLSRRTPSTRVVWTMVGASPVITLQVAKDSIGQSVELLEGRGEKGAHRWNL